MNNMKQMRIELLFKIFPKSFVCPSKERRTTCFVASTAFQNFQAKHTHISLHFIFYVMWHRVLTNNKRIQHWTMNQAVNLSTEFVYIIIFISARVCVCVFMFKWVCACVCVFLDLLVSLILSPNNGFHIAWWHKTTHRVNNSLRLFCCKFLRWLCLWLSHTHTLTDSLTHTFIVLQ